MAALTTTSLSHLKFRHLMLVNYLCEFGTLHKAARALHISQPAATAMLNDLEALLAVTLFERSHRGVKPTELGQQLMGSLGTLLNEYQHFTESLDRLTHGRDHVLRVGLVPQAFVTYLPQAIAEFRAAGGCDMRVQEGTAAQLLDLLWDGQLDCVVGRLPPSGLGQRWDAADLCFEHLYAERICIVTGLKLAKQHAVPPSFEWLATQQWVLQRPDSSVRQALNEAFLRHGVVPPTPVVETSTYVQSMALVSDTSLYTVAPRSAVQRQQALGSFQVLDVDLGAAPLQVSFIHRATSKNNAQMASFKVCFRGALVTEGR